MIESATSNLQQIGGSAWDAIVIGAGPAGALAGHQLASQGLRTLIVEAARFPRPKVCGGCINRRGITALRAVGLAHLVDESRADCARHLHLVAAGRRARIALSETCVVDRAHLDHALAQEAIAQGAHLVDGAPAVVEPYLSNGNRVITIAQDDVRATLSTAVVICADGLSRSSLKRIPSFSTFTRPGSRIGVGATIPHVDGVAADEITMLVGRQGYVGLARNPSNHWNIAAALDASAFSGTTVEDVIRRTVTETGISVDVDWPALAWRGTPRLTSCPNHVAAERLFVIGDASGYVEPFSGEGMATAFETALAVVPLAVRAIHDWRPSVAAEWEQGHRRLVVDRQAPCKQLAWIVRRRWATTTAITLCRAQPWVARQFLARIS